MSSTLQAVPNNYREFEHLARTAADLRSRLMNFEEAIGSSHWRSLTTQPAAFATTAGNFGLVDVRGEAPLVRHLPAPPWSSPRGRFLVRPELARRLHEASRALPAGHSLGFWEGYRPLAVQNALWQTGLELLGETFPGHAPFELEAVLETYVARPTPGAPHSLGTAVDIALLDGNGQILDDSDGLRILAMALIEAGLSNYAPEWWHWSYDGAEVDYLQ